MMSPLSLFRRNLFRGSRVSGKDSRFKGKLKLKGSNSRCSTARDKRRGRR
jgi:hypothetical protein